MKIKDKVLNILNDAGIDVTDSTLSKIFRFFSDDNLEIHWIYDLDNCLKSFDSVGEYFLEEIDGLMIEYY